MIKNGRTLLEEVKITYRRRNLTVWKVYYFSKSNMFRLVIDGKWLPGAFISRDKIDEAYAAYKTQGYTVEIKKIAEIKIKRRRG